MPAPAVSVVIPTYNRALLIGAAIDSVLAQTLPGLEIIVVDDGSTDDTESVVRGYGDQVRYVRIDRGGIAHARNVGMSLARGRYLTFLDSDDLLEPCALELEAQLLDRFPGAAMACAEMTGFDDHGFVERYHVRNYHSSSFRGQPAGWDSIFGSSRPLEEVCSIPAALLESEPGVRERRVYVGNIFDTYLERLVLCQNTAMIRREVVEEIGPRREHIYTYQEYDYLLRLSRHHDILFVDVPTYRLRYHPGQISTLAVANPLKVQARKQRSLLRVFERHATADPVYYEAHRARLDRRMAHLCRGAAVPMLLTGVGGGGADRRRAARDLRCARMYLVRCRQLGHPQTLLMAVSYLPGALRRASVRLIDGVRRDGAGQLLGRAAASLRRRLAGRRVVRSGTESGSAPREPIVKH